MMGHPLTHFYFFPVFPFCATLPLKTSENLWLYIIIMSSTFFQSKSILFSCLNVKDIIARNSCDIWSLSDSNRIRIHNHWVCKWTLISLVNLPVRLNGWVFVHELSGCRFESRYCHLQKTFWLSDVFRGIKRKHQEEVGLIVSNRYV